MHLFGKSSKRRGKWDLTTTYVNAIEKNVQVTKASIHFLFDNNGVLVKFHTRSLLNSFRPYPWPAAFLQMNTCIVVRYGPVPLIPDETEKEDFSYNFTTTKTKFYCAGAVMTREMT